MRGGIPNQQKRKLRKQTVRVKLSASLQREAFRRDHYRTEPPHMSRGDEIDASSKLRPSKFERSKLGSQWEWMSVEGTPRIFLGWIAKIALA